MRSAWCKLLCIFLYLTSRWSPRWYQPVHGPMHAWHIVVGFNQLAIAECLCTRGCHLISMPTMKKDILKSKSGRKEGRKTHINSRRQALIGCTDSIQVIKTIHDKVCNTDNIQLPQCCGAGTRRCMQGVPLTPR